MKPYASEALQSSLALHLTDWRWATDPSHSDVVLVVRGREPDWLASYQKNHPQRPVLRLAEPETVSFAEQLIKLKHLPTIAHIKNKSENLTALLLMAWLEDGISVTLEGKHPQGYYYPFDYSIAEVSLTHLVKLGCLKMEVAEVAYACPKCDSIKLLLRDGCYHCNSIHIAEAPLIHHFPCAYHDLERHFLNADMHYRCPKCLKELSHIGVDYDKPGKLTECSSCKKNHHTTKVVGNCLQCAYHFDLTGREAKKLYNYFITGSGLHYLFSQDALPNASRSILFTYSEFTKSITTFNALWKNRNTPFSLIVLIANRYTKDPLLGIPDLNIIAITIARDFPCYCILHMENKVFVLMPEIQPNEALKEIAIIKANLARHFTSHYLEELQLTTETLTEPYHLL